MNGVLQAFSPASISHSLGSSQSYHPKG